MMDKQTYENVARMLNDWAFPKSEAKHIQPGTYAILNDVLNKTGYWKAVHDNEKLNRDILMTDKRNETLRKKLEANNG